MTSSIAFFTKKKNKLDAYPIDGHMNVVFEKMLSIAKNRVQIAVVRDGNLLHYGYVRQFNSDEYVGINVTCPAVMGNVQALFALCDKTFSNLVSLGIVVHYTHKGEQLYFVKKTLAEQKEYLDPLADTMMQSLDKDNNFDYSDLPAALVSVSIDTVVSHSLNEGSDAIRRSLEKYYTVYITSTKEEIELLTSVSSQLRSQSQMISSLEQQVVDLKRQKRQYGMIAILFVVLMLGATIAVAAISGKNRVLKDKDSQIGSLNADVELMGNELHAARNELGTVKSRLEKITGYTYMVGASPREGDGGIDKMYVMWLIARQPVRINYFYVQGYHSGNVTVRLCDENDNVVSSYSFHIQAKEWQRVTPGSFVMKKPGYYYLDISSSECELRYHSSNNEEFSRYRVGALQIIGCCHNNEKNNPDARKQSGWYEYFYNINYSILNNTSVDSEDVNTAAVE